MSPLDGPKNSISAIETCLSVAALYDERMTKRTDVTSPTRNVRR
ncbi:hypothetical protein ACFVXW_27775 [Streptomyces sp. NPDC058251]